MNFSRVPKIRRVVLEMTHKAGCDDRRFVILEMALLQLLTGKTPEPIFAKSANSALQVRRNQCIGTKLELKNSTEMRRFLTKACMFAMARDEDFNGLSKGALMNGNYKFELKSLLFFPETELFYEIFETVPSIGVRVYTDVSKYHIACDPTRFPLSDYYWLQRDGFKLNKIENLLQKRKR